MRQVFCKDLPHVVIDVDVAVSVDLVLSLFLLSISPSPPPFFRHELLILLLDLIAISNAIINAYGTSVDATNHVNDGSACCSHVSIDIAVSFRIHLNFNLSSDVSNVIVTSSCATNADGEKTF